MKKLSQFINVEVANNDDYPSFSRYAQNRYYNRKYYDVNGTITPTIEQEIWRLQASDPKEDDSYVRVLAGEVGRLDLISQRVYKTDALWWIIALANDIIDPFEETYVDRTLRCPNLTTVLTETLPS